MSIIKVVCPDYSSLAASGVFFVPDESDGSSPGFPPQLEGRGFSPAVSGRSQSFPISRTLRCRGGACPTPGPAARKQGTASRPPTSPAAFDGGGVSSHLRSSDLSVRLGRSTTDSQGAHQDVRRDFHFFISHSDRFRTRRHQATSLMSHGNGRAPAAGGDGSGPSRHARPRLCRFGA